MEMIEMTNYRTETMLSDCELPDEMNIKSNDITTTDAMWSPVESGADEAAPCARAKHSATLLGGHVFVLGGRGAGGAVPLRDFWQYSLADGSWGRVAARGEAPPALQEHSATAHGGRLYVFGGEAGASTLEVPLWIFDVETEEWRKLPGAAPTGARRGAGGVRDAGGVRAAGGAGPRGRRGHSAHALKDCLLIYGGYKDLRGSTNELWAFHYESESWQQVRTSTAGPARHRHAAALHDARLYVHAGQCDLRVCSDLWHYDTMSRAWTQVRCPAKLSPAPRSGHAAARAGAHLYIFGGDVQGHTAADMWRFHFASETWERIEPSSPKWPPARVDGRALLVPGGARGAIPPAPRAPPRAAPPGLLRELSRLSSFHIRRAARCSYSALAGGERDSTESLVRQEAALSKSHSAYGIRRQPEGADGPREGDVPAFGSGLARDPRSVPDFSELEPPQLTRDDDAELSTSDYASAERVNRLAGFSNPHYLGPDVRALTQALTPDSGLGAADIELRDLARRRPARLHLLLVGGREPPHVALLQSPLSMWSYRLL